MEIYEAFEEDIEYTPARFFPTPNQITPIWTEKIKDLEKIDPKTPEYAGVLTVRYLHALAALYEDQYQEKVAWIDRYRRLGAELLNARWELYRANRENLILKHKLDTCFMELQGAQRKIYNQKIIREADKFKSTTEETTG